jgi:transcriptional regulator with XRE-family HTH domain
MGNVDLRTEIRDFLSTRRARITPEEAGLPAYGGNRRVKGLRREEVAMLAGVSVDYYVRMERGSLAGASESVLEALADALRLEEAERAHLFALARESGARSSRRTRTVPTNIRLPILQVLDAMTGAPAWVRNGRHDVLAMNSLARALYSPVLADPRRPANTTRFVYLQPEAAREFFVDYDRIARDAAAMLRLEAGRNPQRQGAHRAGRRAVDPVRALPHPLGLPRRAVPSQRPQATSSPGRRPARPRLRVAGAGLRARARAQHLHRCRGQPGGGRAQAAGLVGGVPGGPRHRDRRGRQGIIHGTRQVLTACSIRRGHRSGTSCARRNG